MQDGGNFDPKYLSLLWATSDRAEDIAQIHSRLFDPPWDAATLRRMLDQPTVTAFVATFGQPSLVVGYVLAQMAADEAEILSIGVDSGWQRRGVGTLLVDGLIRALLRAEVKRIFLEVADDNAAGIALYQKLGFTQIGRRKGYYVRPGTGPVDAVAMARSLGA